MGHIQSRARKLLKESLSRNSRLAYRTALNSFNKFCTTYSLSKEPALSLHNIIMYIAYCSEKDYSAKTIMTYMHGLSFYQKLANLNSLFQSFLVQKMLEGVKRLGTRADTRAPLTRGLLSRLCQSLPSICKSPYETLLFQAAFSLAYFGLFRVGELVLAAQDQNDRPIRTTDVSFCGTNKAVIVQIRCSKTNRLPVKLRIPCDRDENICCVCLLRRYVVMRPKLVGLFFSHRNLMPLTRYQFSAVLAKVMHLLQLPGRQFRTHSFRIGRASDLHAMGVPDQVVQKMGRWQSSAFQTYIRL